MSELLLDRFHIGTGGTHQRCACVTKVVGSDVSKVFSSSAASWIPNCSSKVRVAQRTALRFGEYQCLWIVGYVFEVAAQYLRHEWWQVDRSRLIGFRGTEGEPPRDVCQCFTDVEPAAQHGPHVGGAKRPSLPIAVRCTRGRTRWPSASGRAWRKRGALPGPLSDTGGPVD